MAEQKSTVVPLDGSNYATWKVQCKMALIKDDVWSLVDDTEPVPVQYSDKESVSVSLGLAK